MDPSTIVFNVMKTNPVLIFNTTPEEPDATQAFRAPFIALQNKFMTWNIVIGTEMSDHIGCNNAMISNDQVLCLIEIK